MDTIVILDRIRENVKVMQGQPYDRIVNTSILQTMTRSFNTLATVVITLVALLAFGGASLKNFAFALLVGICSGGYHSIFFSAPLVNVLRERQLKSAAGRRRLAREAAAERPRTVAEARAQSVRGISREEILQARKERRKRSAASARPAGGPARYKRKRIEPPPGSSPAAQSAVYEDDHLDEDEHDPLGVEHDHTHDALGHEHDDFESAHEYEGAHDGLDDYGRELDPLDAQNAGHHERELSLGHEEINLNFDDIDEPKPTEAPAAAKHE
jgi:hypothetical protein